MALNQQAILQAAATITAAKLQANATKAAATSGIATYRTAQGAAELLAISIHEVLSAVKSVEAETATDVLQLWNRLGGQER